MPQIAHGKVALIVTVRTVSPDPQPPPIPGQMLFLRSLGLVMAPLRAEMTSQDRCDLREFMDSV